MKRIILFTRKLDQGGAERQLVALAKGLKQRGRDVRVLSFYDDGFYDRELEDAGVALYSARKHGRYDIVGFLFRTIRLFRQLRPEVVYSFLSTPNLLSALLYPFIGRPRLVWSVRAAYMDMHRYDWLARWTSALENFLSRFAHCIIANSHKGKAWAIERGFPENRIQVIENGIDVQYFSPDAEGRRRLRHEWSVAEHERLIGMAARLDVMKDYPNFLHAAALLAQRQERLRFVCVGDGTAAYRMELKALAERLGLAEKLIWAGARADMPAVFSALEVFVSASAFGEGFSNSIGESMACGVPCVVTDVGDSARIVGDLGVVVPPRDAKALAEGMEQLLQHMDNEPDLQAQVRARIAQKFSLEHMIARHEALLYGDTGGQRTKNKGQ
ncbi:MAG: glycosyltransferase [Zoogloeaceae bacterium]|jgi:glycosyltransferase involved in cell wall biosynthesis|nr:glycosyltransferase [Zoogloeaceae bacterium]